MPLIAQLPHGVAIYFYYLDHNPPHFHAKGPGWMIRINIADIGVLSVSGQPPVGMEQDLLDFAGRRQAELALCWTRCQGGVKPGKVQP